MLVGNVRFEPLLDGVRNREEFIKRMNASAEKGLDIRYGPEYCALWSILIQSMLRYEANSRLSMK